MADPIIPESTCACKHNPSTKKTIGHPLIAPLDYMTIPPEGPYVITEAADTHAMYLDGQLVGVARTKDEAHATLAELMDEIARETRIVSADIAADRAALLVEVA
jgi:hypothetical protein